MKFSIKRTFSLLALAAALLGACKFTSDFASFATVYRHVQFVLGADAHTSGVVFVRAADGVRAFKEGREIDWIKGNFGHVAASTVSNSAWTWSNDDRVTTFRRWRLHDNANPTRTALITAPDWERINAFDIGPGETLYVAGIHKELGAAIGRCTVVDRSTCNQWIVQNRRGDAAFALQDAEAIEVDPSTGRVIVYDRPRGEHNPTPRALLTYTAALAPTNKPGLTLDDDIGSFAIASRLLAVLDYEGEMKLYFVGDDGSMSFQDSRRNVNAAFMTGYATSGGCGKIWTVSWATHATDRSEITLDRYGVCAEE